MLLVIRCVLVGVCAAALGGFLRGHRVAPPAPANDPYAPLWLYQGRWREMADGQAQFELKNDCARVGEFFACQQTVHGKVVALVVFVPAERRGHYFNQSVAPDGAAGGRGELTIDGDHWTYDSKAGDSTSTVFYRTTNDFTGRDRIHYELLKSADGQHWTKTGSGDERRLPD